MHLCSGWSLIVGFISIFGFTGCDENGLEYGLRDLDADPGIQPQEVWAGPTILSAVQIGTNSWMKLSQLLSEKAILLDIKDIDKWELIYKLTDILVETGQVSSEVLDPIHTALVAREKSMSTGMENGIAIPHCCVDLIHETVVSLGISKEGIQFDSIDDKPTHLIILLVTPKNKTKMHIKTLAEIAKLLNHEESRHRLLEAETPADTLRIIREEEKEDYMA